MKTIVTLDKANQPYGFPQLDESGSLQATGSLYGTSSWAISASWAPTQNIDTTSLVTTSSFNAFTSSYNTGSFTGSFRGDGSGLTNLPVQNINTSSLATTGSNTFRGNQVVTGSLNVTQGITGSLFGTASWAENSLTASYITASNVDGLPPPGVPYTGADNNVDLGAYSLSAYSLVTQTNGSTKRMTLSSNNVQSEKVAEWQDKDYLGIADITDIPDVSGLVTTLTFNEFTSSYNTGSFTGSFRGDGSGLTNLPVQSIDTSSFATTGSNTFTGSQTITGSNGRLIYKGTTPAEVTATLAEIHANDDLPWLHRFYNDTFSTSSAVMAYYGYNDGRFVFHNESTQSIGLQVNGYSAENGLLIYSDKVAFVNNVEVTGSLLVSGSITGSLFGTASISTNIVVTDDTATDAVYYPILSPSSSGAVGARVDSSVLSYNPNTNTLTTGDILLASSNDPSLTIEAITGGGAEIKLLPASIAGYARINVGNTNYPLDFQMNSVDVMRITQAGDIGIGTIEPNAKLDVNGNAIITGSLTVTNGITGSLFGTASWATNAITASYITASNVYGPFGANSILSASYANYALTASSAQNAEDIIVYVKNVTGAQINKGKVVRIAGATGDNALISTASYEADGLSANTLGITSQNIPNDSFGYVITEGKLVGIDTSNFIAGQVVYLGPTGSIIGTAPIAPLHSVRLGEVLRVQQNNGSMYVRIDNGYELGELHDVLDNSTTSSYGDLLVKSGSVWTNSNQLTGSYGLTGSLQATSFSGSFSGSGANLNSIPASAITGLNLSQIATGSVTASVSPTQFTVSSGSSTELVVTGTGVTLGSALTDTHTVTGSLNITGSISATTYNNLINSLETFNTTQGVYYFQDFLNGPFVATIEGTDISTRVLSGGAGGETITAALTWPNRTSQQGVLQLVTGTNAAAQLLIRIGSFNNASGMYFGNGEVVFEAYVNVDTLSTAAQRFQDWIGWSQTSTLATTPCYQFVYDEGGVSTNGGAASANWKCCSNNGTTRVNTDTGVPVVAGQWYKLRIVVNATNTQVNYLIDGTNVATHTSGVGNSALAAKVAHYKSIGTTSRLFYIDYLMIKQVFTTPR